MNGGRDGASLAGARSKFLSVEHLYQRTYIRGRDGRGCLHRTTGGGSPLYRLSELARKQTIAVTLPDSSSVTWARARSMYHYCRLVIVRHPKPGEERVTLEVNRVRSSDRVYQIDRVDLTQAPREENVVPLKSK